MSEELDRDRFGQETQFREREIALKEREVSLKESESKKSRWHDPVFVALIAAILALLGNIYSSVSNARVAAKASTDNANIAAYTSRRNALLESIIEVIHNDPDKAELKLNILLTTKVIADDDGLVSNALASGLFKKLAATPTQTAKTPPGEVVIAQQEMSVEHGGIAHASDPACTQFNDAASLRDKFANQPAGTVISSPASEGSPTCAAIRIAVPSGRTIARVALEAREPGQDWKPCQVTDGQWRVCDIGWSAWSFEQNGNSVIGIFKNWSGDRPREARILIYGQ